MEKTFLIKDLSGRGYFTEYKLDELSQLDKDYDSPDDDTIADWGEFAEIGDEYTEIPSMKIIRIK